jgi:hypothetical protein
MDALPVTCIRLIFCPVLTLGFGSIELSTDEEMRVMSEPESRISLLYGANIDPSRHVTKLAELPRKEVPGGLACWGRRVIKLAAVIVEHVTRYALESDSRESSSIADLDKFDPPSEDVPTKERVDTLSSAGVFFRLGGS